MCFKDNLYYRPIISFDQKFNIREIVISINFCMESSKFLLESLSVNNFLSIKIYPFPNGKLVKIRSLP